MVPYIWIGNSYICKETFHAHGISCNLAMPQSIKVNPFQDKALIEIIKTQYATCLLVGKFNFYADSMPKSIKVNTFQAKALIEIIKTQYATCLLVGNLNFYAD